jgi:phosphoribosyl 1,2-cyclic phosphate phosphodiesterase
LEALKQDIKITFLGTGTSHGVPAIACNCAVCKSDDFRDKRLRVSVLIETAEKKIVIDTGPDFRTQMLRENVQSLDAVIFTHEHKDHTAGLDDIRAFNIEDKPMQVYATKRVQDNLIKSFEYIFADARYPGIPKIRLNTIGNTPFYIGEMEIMPIEVRHLHLAVLGFRIGDFTYITDANFISEDEKQKIFGTKVLVLNALRTIPHISHFSLSEAISLAKELKAETTYFTHISHEMGKYADVEHTLPPGINLAYDGLTLMI